MKNIPYVKEYKDGVLINPIKGSYLHTSSEGRNDRRAHLSKSSFRGNVNHISLTVNGKFKFARVVQHEFDSEGKAKQIIHYLIR